MSEYTDQLLTERRVNLARIAELEAALEDLVERVKINGGLGEYKGGAPFALSNADNALKGTK